MSDSDNFINTIRKVIDGFKLNNEITVFTGDMNINIVRTQENNNKYLNL